jgi:hypothetical protein
MGITTDGVNNIRAPVPVEAPGAVATIGEVRQELYQRALQRLVGQSLQGQVLSRYTDGSFLVKFADTAARVILPPNTQIGDSLPLTLVTVQPRPTFLLGNEVDGKLGKSPLVYLDPHGSEEVELSGADQEPPPPALPQNRGAASSQARQFAQIDSLLRPSDKIPVDNKAATSAETPHAGPPGSAQASLSNAAQLINSILQSAQQNGAPTTLQGKVAILPQANTAAPQVAAALQDTLTYSGLFYESHVNEWVDGKRPITELMREPQMQGTTPSERANSGSDNIAFPQMVNLQLGTLEQQATHWRGEIWPGQTMEWDVQRDGQHAASGGQDAPQSWQSTVRFELPSLGTVSASLHLIGEHLHIQVQTASEESANLLRGHAAELANALDAAGSPLDSLLVQQNEQA